MPLPPFLRSLSTALLAALLAGPMVAGPAQAQRGRADNPFDDRTSSSPNTTYQGSQGFSFPGDELPPSYDRKVPQRPDPRYSQTVQEQQRKAQEQPGGGCLRYGAAGALGGYALGHSVIGALAGCATGAYVRHRDKQRIEEGR